MTAAEQPVVSIDHLTVRYGRTNAVDGISLDVPPGSVYALLGRNGAGKSTTVRCLLGQWKPSGGRVRLFGRDVRRERASLMARVGVVPERDEIPPAMTVEHLGRFFAALYRSWDQTAYDERLDRFSVPRRHPFVKMSKGQQRQLSLALALATQPELLVLDDPTLGLDAVARRELLEELIGELADRGTTVFVATNDIAGIEGVADRVGILGGGRLLVDDEVETLKRRVRRIRSAEAGAVRLGDTSAEVVASHRVAGGTEIVVRMADAGAEANGLGKDRPQSMSLEEIFVALCGPNGGGAA
jgi:ABC-2 type transport system ATP-binding protein